MKLKIVLEILEGYSCASFGYNGKNCGIDPYSSNDYYMWYGEDIDYRAKSIDDVLNSKLFDGKCLKDIAEEIDVW